MIGGDLRFLSYKKKLTFLILGGRGLANSFMCLRILGQSYKSFYGQFVFIFIVLITNFYSPAAWNNSAQLNNFHHFLFYISSLCIFIIDYEIIK